MKIRAVLAVLVLGLIGGCASANYKVHPGAGGYISGTATAVQVFDSQEYDAISAASVVIQGVQADYLAGKFPASAMPTIRTATNSAVAAYNDAQAQWMAFDGALKAGGTPGQSALISAVAAMNNAISQLTTLRGGK